MPKIILRYLRPFLKALHDYFYILRLYRSVVYGHCRAGAGHRRGRV